MHRIAQAELERVGDQRVADRHLVDAGHGADEIGEVGEAQVVAGVDAQPERQRGLGGARELREHLGLARRAVRAGVGLGVELDAVGAERAHRGHRLGHRIHEQAHAHAQRAAFLDQRAQAVGVLGEVPAVVGGELVLAVGHEGGLVRAHARG